MRIFLLLTALLAACSGPTPYFAGQPETVVEVGGAVFHIRRKGDLAEAVRVNREWAPRIGAVAERVTVAIQQATGCDVRDIRGDAAVIVARLKCPK